MGQPHNLSRLGSLVLIAAVLGGGAATFAYTAGWFSPQRLTPEKMVEALTPPGIDPIGHRRNHAKGICFMRELHWHPNANEWRYYLEGQARIGVFAARQVSA
jgi:catalase